MTAFMTNDDLFAMAETVWSNMLGLELTRDESDAAKIGDTAVIATVQITGDWEGAVFVAVPRTLATTLACAMFQMEAADIDDEMLRDAMGEIANMTGGSVKGLTPGENTLTLPQVAEGGEGTVSISRTRTLNSVAALCNDEPVLITIKGRAEE